MKPPDNESRGPGRPPTSTTTSLSSTLDQKDHSEVEVTKVEQVKATPPSWRDLITERPQPSPEILAKPTLGAWRRAHGVTGWSDYARVYLATLLVEEAQRRILLERLDSIMQFLAAGARPDQAVGRLVRLVDEYHGGEIHREMAA